MHQDLAAFYENPEVPNSFGGVEALHRSVKGKYSKKDVKHWLSQKDAYTLHKPVRHKFQRNRVFVSDIDRQFQADLVDMQSLAEFNKGYKYLLTCIDLFSKFAWAVPLKDKFGKSVKSGLEIIFKERKPKVLQTDAAGDGNISSTVKRTIDVGCYETMLDIISAVQLALPKNPNRFTIIYNKATKRVKINAVQGSSLHLENLGELLGFKRNAIIIGNMKSEFVADAWSNFSVFYVYSDLISPQIVGDTQAPLLRIVRTKGKDGETISQYYDRPQYLPLVRHSFQTIQSELRLNSGDFVPFERVKGGKTIGKEVLMTGSRVASDVLSGENFKEAVKTRSKESGKKLAQKAIDRVQSMVGKGQYKRKHSPECVKSELELFNLPGTQTVIQDGQWKQFHPLSNVFDNAPVEFHISGSAEDYIDLSQTQLYVKAKIVKVDNTPITKDDTIGPVNLFLHSLFSQVDVSLNDRVVSNSSNTYPYRSYIETLLNHGYDSKTSQLTAELFYKDSDDGLKKRTEFFKESATVDMIGCIHSDLFHQDRLLLNLVDLKIKLIRSKPEFCLQGSEGFKVVLDHVSLFIRKVRVNPGVILGHAKALEKTSAKYPINRVLCKVYSIPKGSMSFIQDNIFSGQMPKKTFCRMCR
ncbi:uncharacterized protein F54H12.2 [Trichonephila clavipes]|uniref:Uncharacterized protein F54H12.2 n=1 Tax=Trichonephila clavipes TaxID=2585209 RepID=A0A8X6R5K4_TRICX|nr:uncharacterized protein F54H12.2 [Trichonephila clavipes]